MNNRFFLIAILIYLSVQVLGQDVVPRQAPIDNMSSFEDSINNDKGDNSEFTKIPIIIDSTEGWEWIDKEESEDVFEAYPLRLSYNKYKSHPLYRVIGDEIFNGKPLLICQAAFLPFQEPQPPYMCVQFLWDRRLLQVPCSSLLPLLPLSVRPDISRFPYRR